MQIISLSSVLLALSILACSGTQAKDSVTSPSILNFKSSSGQHYSVAVERDKTVLSNTKPKKIEEIGEIKAVAAILVDTYPSIPLGMSYCQAGEESFLRVITIAKQPPVETFHIKLESCRENLELASPGLEWIPDASKLVIHWLQGPTTPHKPETRTLVINAEGKVVP